MVSKYVIPKFASCQIFPSQTEFCCSSSTDEDLSSIQYSNILCQMAFNIGLHFSAIHFSVFSKKYTNQMIPFQFKFKKKQNDRKSNTFHIQIESFILSTVQF